MHHAEGERNRPLVLIADDDQLLRLSYRDALEQAGFRTVCAADSETSLSEFLHHQPDLVVLDLVMPGTGGLAVCREIRTLPGHAHTPILMVTGSEETEALHASYEAGATDFIAKPINPELLAYRVRYILRASMSMQELAVSEARLASAQRIAHLGNWEWDLASGAFRGSVEMFRILGIGSPPRQYSFDDFIFTVYPSDQRMVELTLKQGCATKTACSLECRIKRADGTLRTVRMLCDVKEYGDGRLPNLIGTLQDISEMKQVEEHLQLLKEAVDSLPIGITISDIHGKIIYTNPADAEIHGYTVSELTGKHARIFAPEFLQKPFTPEKLDKFGLWKRESVNVRKNGKEFPVQLSSITVRNADGRHLGIVTSCEDITTRKETEERIHRLAYHDNLTGLPNRRHLLDRLQQALALAHREGRQVALIFLDLDNFKDVNDTQGHDFGDKLLREVAIRLAAGMRESDTLARLGGDEFVVVLTSIANHASAALFAQRILALFAQPFTVTGQQIYTSASIGIALYPDDSFDADSLFKCADTAMYYAKNEGRRNYRFFSAEMNEKIMHRVALEHRLHLGLARQEFFLLFQPQVDMKTGRLVGVEALLRWQSGDMGLLSPTDFIPLAEKTGLIFRLGEWVLRTACLAVRDLERRGFPDLRMAVNISGKQFRQPGFLTVIERVIRETGADPRHLELEFTESVVMEKAEKTIRTLRALKKMGVMLSIDDFGTGYSSLSYLKHFPIDLIKIDRSFIAEMTHREDCGAIVCAITSLGKTLNIATTAEGIETPDQLELLRLAGCEQAQGYLFGRPVPVGELSFEAAAVADRMVA